MSTKKRPRESRKPQDDLSVQLLARQGGLSLRIQSARAVRYELAFFANGPAGRQRLQSIAGSTQFADSYEDIPIGFDPITVGITSMRLSFLGKSKEGTSGRVPSEELSYRTLGAAEGFANAMSGRPGPSRRGGGQYVEDPYGIYGAGPYADYGVGRDADAGSGPRRPTTRKRPAKRAAKARTQKPRSRR
jgi:hypothetical protein